MLEHYVLYELKKCKFLSPDAYHRNYITLHYFSFNQVELSNSIPSIYQCIIGVVPGGFLTPRAV